MTPIGPVAPATSIRSTGSQISQRVRSARSPRRKCSDGSRRLSELLAAAAVLLTATTIAHARVYNYGCQTTDVRGNTRLYTAKLDTSKRTITWRGRMYKNLKELDSCKAEFEATASNGDTVHLCTATQGVADLTVNFGQPGDDGVEEVECNIINN
jgi:hypothetical protein